MQLLMVGTGRGRRYGSNTPLFVEFERYNTIIVDGQLGARVTVSLIALLLAR